MLEPFVARERALEVQSSFALLPKPYPVGGSPLFSWRPTTALLCGNVSSVRHSNPAAGASLARYNCRPDGQTRGYSCPDCWSLLDGQSKHHHLRWIRLRELAGNRRNAAGMSLAACNSNRMAPVFKSVPYRDDIWICGLVQYRE